MVDAIKQLQKESYMAKMAMIGFTEMRRIVTECFLSTVFKPDSIEHYMTIDELLIARRSQKIDWIVYSIYCLGVNIEETLALLKECYAETNHVCYSEFPITDNVALRCKKSGISHLVCNLNTYADVACLISSVSQGLPYYQRNISELDTNEEQNILACSNDLTQRQYAVLRCALMGKTIKETAGELGVTPKTVSTHRARYNEKLKNESLCNQFATAVMMNLVSPFEVIRSLRTGER